MHITVPKFVGNSYLRDPQLGTAILNSIAEPAPHLVGSGSELLESLRLAA